MRLSTIVNAFVTDLCSEINNTYTMEAPNMQAVLKFLELFGEFEELQKATESYVPQPRQRLPPPSPLPVKKEKKKWKPRKPRKHKDALVDMRLCVICKRMRSWGMCPHLGGHIMKETKIKRSDLRDFDRDSFRSCIYCSNVPQTERRCRDGSIGHCFRPFYTIQGKDSRTFLVRFVTKQYPILVEVETDGFVYDLINQLYVQYNLKGIVPVEIALHGEVLKNDTLLTSIPDRVVLIARPFCAMDLL